MKTICSSDADSRHPVNRIIKCSSDGICGNYKSLRRNDQFVEAVDLSCREGNFIYSPFEGKLSSWRPFNGNGLNEIERHEIKRNNNNNKCLPDRGVRIDGVGQWQGYHVLIGSVRLFRYSGHVLAGQKIGIALDIECEIKLIKSPIRSRKEENFIRIYLHKEGRPIDPTHHLIDCMCLNQICETNRINSLEGSPFKFDSRFNGVRGWEIKCPDIVQQNEENSFSEEEEEENNNKEDNLNEQWGIPRIYSPIEGELVGRIRINSEPGAQAYSGCTNEGIFIVGAGKWNDYEVRIYNARFLESLPLGRQNIEQGQHIGYRLVCPNDQITPTVFIEVRFQGVLIDISDAISAKNCKHKSLRNLIF